MARLSGVGEVHGIVGEVPDGIVLPPLTDQYAYLKFVPVTKFCPFNLNTNDEATAKHGGKKRHYWLPIEVNWMRGSSWSRTRHQPEGLPNWSWCNHCGVVNTERPICEAHVFSSYGYSRCNRQAVMQSREYTMGKPMGRIEDFCKMHDAETRHLKQVAANIKFHADWDAARARDQKESAQRTARNELAEAALEVLEWMEVSRIHEEDEWAGTIHKRIKKARDDYATV